MTSDWRQLTFDRRMTTPGALTLTQPRMSRRSTTVFGLVMVMSPSTTVSWVPAGTPVQVASGYPGRAQELPCTTAERAVPDCSGGALAKAIPDPATAAVTTTRASTAGNFRIDIAFLNGETLLRVAQVL